LVTAAVVGDAASVLTLELSQLAERHWDNTIIVIIIIIIIIIITTIIICDM